MKIIDHVQDPAETAARRADEDAEYALAVDRARGEANAQMSPEDGPGVTWALLAVANRLDRIATILTVRP